MNYSINEKIKLLYKWIITYNTFVRDELNNSQTNENKKTISDNINIVLSVLLGVNLTKNPVFEGIENLTGVENPTVNFIRNSSVEELQKELTSLSDDKGIKKNISSLNPNKIIDLFYSIKEKKKVTTNKKENITKNYDYSTDKNNNLKDIHKTGLDCLIDGVRVVITPNTNQSNSMQNEESYSQSMEISFNNGSSRQWVNKKVLTKRGFDSFLEKYKEQILGLDNSYENTFLKENTQNLNRDYEF